MTTNPTAMSLYTALFITRCQETFQLLPRQWQVEVGSELIKSHFTNVPIRHLCVHPTGGGKSLVLPVNNNRIDWLRWDQVGSGQVG